MGFETGAAAVETLGLQGTLEGLKKQVNGNGVEFSNLFPSIEASTAALALTGAQAENFTKKTEAMNGAVGATNAAFEEQNKTLDAQIKKFKNYVNTVQIGVGQKVIPVLNKMFKWFFDNRKEIETFWKAWVNNLNLVALETLKFVKKLVDGFSSFVDANREIFISVVSIVKKGLIGMLMIYDEVDQFIRELWEENGEEIREIVRKAWKLIHDAVVFWSEKIGVFWNKHGDKITKRIKETWEEIKKGVKIGWQLILNEINLFLDLLLLDTDGVKDRLKKRWELIWAAVKLVFENQYKMAKEAGEYIMQGLIDGIIAGKDFVLGKFQDVGDSMLQKMRDIFQIKSPSRKMIEFAKYIMEGLQIGLEDGENDVLNTTSKVLGNMIEELENKLKEAGKIAEDGSLATVENTGKYADKVAGIYDADYIKYKELLEAKTKIDKAAAEAAAEEHVKNAKESLKAWKEAFEKAKQEVSKFSQKFIQVTKYIGDKIGGTFGSVLGDVANFGDGVNKILTGDIVGGTLQMIDSVVSAGEKSYKALMKFLNNNKEIAKDVDKAWKITAENIEGYFQNLVIGIGEQTTDFAVSIDNELKNASNNITKSDFADALKGVFEEAGRGIINGMGFVKGGVVGVVKEITKLWKKAKEGPSAYERALGQLQAHIVDFSDDTSSSLEDIANSGDTEFNKLKNSFFAVTGEISELWGRTQQNMTLRGTEAWDYVVGFIQNAKDQILPLIQEMTGIIITETDAIGEALVEALTKRTEEERDAAIRAKEIEIEQSIEAADKKREILAEELEDKLWKLERERDKELRNVEQMQGVYEKQRDDKNQFYQDEIDSATNAHDEKIKLLNAEYIEQVRLIDNQLANQLETLQSGIDAIDAEKEAANKARAEKTYNDDIARQEKEKAEIDSNEKILLEAAKTEEEKKKIREKADKERIKNAEETEKIISARNRELQNETWEEQKENFRDQIQEQKDLAQEAKDNAKDTLDEQVSEEEEILDGQIDKLEKKIETITNFFNKLIDDQTIKLTEQNKEAERLYNVRVESAKNSYEYDLKNFNEIQQLKEDQYNKELTAVQEHYDKLLETANIENEALLLLTDENQQDMLDILKKYNPKYQDAGQTIGQKLLNGLNSSKTSIENVLSDLFGKIDSVNKATETLSTAGVGVYKPPIVPVSNTTNENNGTEPSVSSIGSLSSASGGITQHISVQMPREANEQEIGRQIAESSRVAWIGG
jgi:hypothetical protein